MRGRGLGRAVVAALLAEAAACGRAAYLQVTAANAAAVALCPFGFRTAYDCWYRRFQPMTATVPSPLAIALGRALTLRRLVAATAESCTGGLIAAAITDVPGSSGWFDRGFVTYSNAAKSDMLGVRVETLDAHGAVSEETAAEMARGALEHSGADLAVAVTGVAGPDGGTPAKPVGMVCFAWAWRGGGVETATRRFDGDRAAVRAATVAAALQGLLNRSN
jgi:nicotinamide-nucleotide amidase